MSRKEIEMAGNQTYRVARRHFGDRWYDEGETREALPADVAHLVPHVLEPVIKKAEPAPKNKADAGRKTKTAE